KPNAFRSVYRAGRENVTPAAGPVRFRLYNARRHDKERAMKGKICLVTGANAGIGLQTAHGLASAGATVVMTARSPDKGAKAVADVKEASGNEDVELLELDLASTESVRRAAETFLQRHDRLDVLVNNAG